MRATSRTLAALIAGVAVAFTPGLAHAQSYSHPDATGDNAQVTIDYTNTSAPVSVSTLDSTVDASNVQVNYTKQSLTITTTVADFTATPEKSPAVTYYVATKGNRLYTLELVHVMGESGTIVTDMAAHQLVGSGKAPASCKKMKAAFDTTAHTVSLSVPSSCLRSSKYIQLMGKTYATNELLTETSKWVGNEDDVFSDALYDDDMMSWGTSPVIARGGKGIVVDSPVRLSGGAMRLLVVQARHF